MNDGTTIPGEKTLLKQRSTKHFGASAAQQRAGASSTQKQVREDPLLAPHELALCFARDKRRVLVLVQGKPPLALQRALYDQDHNFQGSFDK